MYAVELSSDYSQMETTRYTSLFLMYTLCWLGYMETYKDFNNVNNV